MIFRLLCGISDFSGISAVGKEFSPSNRKQPACTIGTGRLFFFLLLLNRFERAGCSAGAAFDALIGINYVLVVALGDDAERAAISTASALCASIGDKICHD